MARGVPVEVLLEAHLTQVALAQRHPHQEPQHQGAAGLQGAVEPRALDPGARLATGRCASAHRSWPTASISVKVSQARPCRAPGRLPAGGRSIHQRRGLRGLRVGREVAQEVGQFDRRGGDAHRPSAGPAERTKRSRRATERRSSAVATAGESYASRKPR